MSFKGLGASEANPFIGSHSPTAPRQNPKQTARRRTVMDVELMAWLRDYLLYTGQGSKEWKGRIVNEVFQEIEASLSPAEANFEKALLEWIDQNGFDVAHCLPARAGIQLQVIRALLAQRISQPEPPSEWRKVLAECVAQLTAGADAASQGDASVHAGIMGTVEDARILLAQPTESDNGGK